MKILYISNIRIPTEKAHGIQIMKMCEAFARLGQKVTLVVPRRLNPIQKDPYEYYGVEKIFNIKKIPTFDLVRFGKIGFLIQSISFAKFVFIYALSAKSDIFYSRDEWPLYFLSFFKDNIIFEGHTNRYNLVVKRVLRKSKKIITITQGLKDFYIKKGIDERKIFVAPDGVDVNDFYRQNKEKNRKHLGIPLNFKIIAYIGKYKTMNVKKGVDELIESFSLCKRNNSNDNLKLFLIGINNNEVEEIKLIASKFRLNNDDYRIVGHIPRKAAIEYMCSADLLVMNYPNIEHYSLYMSPVKMFEYMASGVPIITSDLPSIREILDEKSAIFFNPGSIRSLSNIINYTLLNEQEAILRAKNAKDDSLLYTWDKRVKKILASLI